MASIKDLNNGSYRIRISAGFDGSGKRRFYTETYTPTAKTLRAIENELSKHCAILQKQVDDGLIAISDGTTFSQFIDTWFNDWATEHLTKSQQDAYMSHLLTHVVPVIGNTKITQVKKKHCIQIINNMKTAGKAPKTIRRIVTAARSVFKYAVYCEIIVSDPFENVILPPIEKDNEIHCFDVAQAQRFLYALTLKYPKSYGGRKRKDSTGKTYPVKSYVTYHEVPFQFQVYFNLAIQAGLRRGEALALTWNDINFDNQIISVTKAVSETKNGQIIGKTKTPSAVREIYVSREVMDLLENWYDQQKEMCMLSEWQGMPLSRINQNPVFIQTTSKKVNGIIVSHLGQRMDLHTPEDRFKRILNDYNALVASQAETLPEDQKKRKLAEQLPVIRLHDLRHTFASILIGNGCDIVTVSKLMGHASPSITMDVYSHLLRRNAQDAARVFENLFQDTCKHENYMQA